MITSYDCKTTLPEFIRKMLEIPYKHKGRDWSGADCGGAIMIFYKDFLGITIPDFNIEYDQNWAVKSDKSHFIENYYKFFDKVDKPKLFNVVLFQTKKGIANHGGIVLNNGKFFHIYRAGASVNYYTDDTFSRRLNGFYRYKKTI
jgi:cell wall-associated NlpC family hydrolase